MRPPAMLGTSALNLSTRRRRQIACRPGTSSGVGWGDNHLAPIQGCTGGGGVVHLFPLKLGDEVSSLSSRVRPSVIVKVKNVGTQHSAHFVLKCTPQLLQSFTINSTVYCCGLGQKFYQENTLSVPQYGAHDLSCWKSLLELFHFRRASMLPVQGLLFWFRCDMGHPCLVSCHNMAQHSVSFLVIAHQKYQSTCKCNKLFFVLLCEHLEHPSCTHFPITQMTTDSVIAESLKSEKSDGIYFPNNLRTWEECMPCANADTDVCLNNTYKFSSYLTENSHSHQSLSYWHFWAFKMNLRRSWH